MQKSEHVFEYVSKREKDDLPIYQRGRWPTVSFPVKALKHVNIAIWNFVHGASVKLPL